VDVICQTLKVLDILTEAKSPAAEIKAELESDEFGMTEKGGNGRVKLKGSTLTVYNSFFFGGKDALDAIVKMWSPNGTYYNYFKEKGFEIKVIGKDKEDISKVFNVKSGRLGHVSVDLEITKD